MYGLHQPRQRAALRRVHTAREAKITPQTHDRYQRAPIKQPGLARQPHPTLAEEKGGQHIATIPFIHWVAKQIALATPASNDEQVHDRLF
jgi:hypothetical protein